MNEVHSLLDVMGILLAIGVGAYAGLLLLRFINNNDDDA